MIGGEEKGEGNKEEGGGGGGRGGGIVGRENTISRHRKIWI
jgi:hypothetical protein